MNRKWNNSILAEKTVKLLNKKLKKDANSTACVLFFQPKAPKELSKFRKK